MSIAVPDWLLEMGDPIRREDHPLKDVIAEAIEELKPADRRAINMYFYEGLIYKDIAEEEGLAGKTSGQYRVDRAVQALAVKLREKGITHEHH